MIPQRPRSRPENIFVYLSTEASGSQTGSLKSTKAGPDSIGPWSEKRYIFRAKAIARSSGIARAREKLVCSRSDLGDFQVKRWLSAIGMRLTGGPRPWWDSALGRDPVTELVYGLSQQITLTKWIVYEEELFANW